MTAYADLRRQERRLLAQLHDVKAAVTRLDTALAADAGKPGPHAQDRRRQTTRKRRGLLDRWRQLERELGQVRRDMDGAR